MNNRFVVGIDLGTSNSVVAVVKDSHAIVIPDSQGRRIHPSVISFHPNGATLVGQEAKRRRIVDGRNTIYSAKRLIGMIAHGSVVFVWYPDRAFLQESEYLDRDEAQERLAAAE